MHVPWEPGGPRNPNGVSPILRGDHKGHSWSLRRSISQSVKSDHPSLSLDHRQLSSSSIPAGRGCLSLGSTSSQTR